MNEATQGYKKPPVFKPTNPGGNWTKEAWDSLQASNKYRADLERQNKLRMAGGIQVGRDQYGNPIYGVPVSKQAQVSDNMRMLNEVWEKRNQEPYKSTYDRFKNNPNLKLNLPEPQPLSAVITPKRALRHPGIEIKEPLFGRNPDGSPKPRPPGMDSSEVLALLKQREQQEQRESKGKKVKSKKANPSTTKKDVPRDVHGNPLHGRVDPKKLPQFSKPKTQSQSPLDRLDQITQARDIYGNEIKTADMLVSGGIKLQQQKRPERTPAATKSGSSGKQFRKIDGRVVALSEANSGANSEESSETTPSGMR